jgi:esterase FrsA
MKPALLLTLVFALNSVASADDQPAMRILETENGTRFGLFGKKPKSPAPTFFVFATGVDDMDQSRIYSEAGRQLARHGWLYVTLDPPCHGRDAREDEPSTLSGWAHRVQNEEDLMTPFVTRCRNVLDWLVAERYTDQNRVAAGGTSRGGLCALHLTASEPRVKAVVCISPVTKLLVLREFAEVEQKQTAQFDAASLADKLAGRAIWISIGNDDERVGTHDCIAACRQFVAAARKKEPDVVAPVELIIAPSKGHTAIDNGYTLAAEFVLKQIPSR